MRIESASLLVARVLLGLVFLLAGLGLAAIGERVAMQAPPTLRSRVTAGRLPENWSLTTSARSSTPTRGSLRVSETQKRTLSPLAFATARPPMRRVRIPRRRLEQISDGARAARSRSCEDAAQRFRSFQASPARRAAERAARS